MAEALFDLATLAADVDREGAGAEIGPKKKRAKAASKRGGKENAASGRGGGTNASAAAVPMPMPPTGYVGGVGAREMGYAMPPPGLASARRPFNNNALHVYIAHFIDFTQQVSKQQQQRVTAQFSRSADGGEHAQQGGASMGGLGPFAGMPPQFGMPPMFNPQLLAAIMSGQMPGAQAQQQQQGQQGQQQTTTTTAQRDQQHGSPTPEAQQAQMNQMMNMMMQNLAAFPSMFGPGFMPGLNPMMMPPQQFMPPGFNPGQFMDPNNPMAFMVGGGAGGAGGVPSQLVDAMNAAQQREEQDQKPPQVQQGAAGVKEAPAPFAAA